jgi:RNase P/RNase MRP subunit p29
MKIPTFELRLRSGLLAFSVVGAVLLSACGPRVQALDRVVMEEEPLKQISANSDTFKQIPQQDLQLLIAYLAVNEKARLSGGQFVEVQGKSLIQVLQDSKVWQVSMLQIMDQSKKIADSISAQVTVQPVDKVIEDGDSPIGKARIMKISYQVSNKSDKAITGVQGNMRYFDQQGRQIAMIQVIFDRRIEAGGNATMFGHSPVLVGSRASKEMVDFAESPATQMKAEFIPLALRYEGGEVIRVPAL